MSPDFLLDRYGTDLRMDAIIAARPDLVPEHDDRDRDELQDKDDWLEAAPGDLVDEHEMDDLYEAVRRQQRVLRCMPVPGTPEP